MSLNGEFRDALERGDLTWLCRFWREKAPNMPQPQDYGEAAIVMHRARTEAETVSLPKRAYSHRWLEERAYPSGLPDHLKPQADRIYPRVAEAVGISIKTNDPYLRPAAIKVREAMEYAVNDAYADGRTDPAFVRQRMEEARHDAKRKLFG